MMQMMESHNVSLSIITAKLVHHLFAGNTAYVQVNAHEYVCVSSVCVCVCVCVCV